jgi:hypothetical protein
MERLLERHLQTERPGEIPPAPKEMAKLSREDTAAAVVLQRHLPGLDSEPSRRRSIENLLNLLEFDEVVRRADRAEPETGQLHDHSGQLLANPVGVTVKPDIDASVLLYSLELPSVDAEPVGRELSAFDRASHNVVCG